MNLPQLATALLVLISATAPSKYAPDQFVTWRAEYFERGRSFILGLKDHLCGDLRAEIQLKRFVQQKAFNAVSARTEKMVCACQCHFHVSRCRKNDAPANPMIHEKGGVLGTQLGLEDCVLQGW